MSSLIGMSLLASSANSFRSMEGLTNGGAKQNEDEMPKSGKTGNAAELHPDDDDMDTGDYHQVDNNGNLENGKFFFFLSFCKKKKNIGEVTQTFAKIIDRLKHLRRKRKKVFFSFSLFSCKQNKSNEMIQAEKND
jgi:hypothetical protein